MECESRVTTKALGLKKFIFTPRIQDGCSSGLHESVTGLSFFPKEGGSPVGSAWSMSSDVFQPIRMVSSGSDEFIRILSVFIHIRKEFVCIIIMMIIMMMTFF